MASSTSTPARSVAGSRPRAHRRTAGPSTATRPVAAAASWLVAILVATAPEWATAAPEDPAVEVAEEAAVACATSDDCARAIHHGSVCQQGRCAPYHDAFSLLDWVGLAREQTGAPPPFVLLPALLPAVGYNPAMGLLVGATGTLGMYLGPAATTTISSLQAVALYSTMDQLTVQVSSTVMSAGNDWELVGDWRFLLFHQDTFGLGTGPQAMGAPAVKEDFDLVRVHEIGYRRVWESLYAGLGYRFDRYYAVREPTDAGGAPSPPGPNLAYSQAFGFDPSQYTVSGPALAVLLDSRDSTINPYRGFHGSAAFTWSPTWLGSSRVSTGLEAQFRAYAPLSADVPRDVVGFWVYYRGVTSGEAPYLALPAIGWDPKNRTGRGYVQGRWRGTHQLYGEVEWRFRITGDGLLGGVVFASAESFAAPAFQASGPGWTYSSARVDLLRFIRPAGGVGLRFMLNRDSRTNVALDVAVGESSFGVWFNAGEYF